MNCDSASWIFTSLPNSVGFTFLPLRIASVCDSNTLSTLPGMMRVALQHAGTRLLQHAPGQRAHVLDLLAQSLHPLTPAGRPRLHPPPRPPHRRAAQRPPAPVGPLHCRERFFKPAFPSSPHLRLSA